MTAKKEYTKSATAVEKSKNAKVGEVSATYSSLKTCPSDCPFKDNGCYAQSGNVFFAVKKLDKNACKRSVLEIAKEEAREISTLTGKRPLRLHVSGDCTTNETAKIVSSACKEYAKKADQPTWTYTHAWKSVDRDSWGDVSVLASCETIEDCEKAMDRGYAAALVVPEGFKGVKREKSVKLVTCLEQAKGVPCVDCKLCFKDKKNLKARRVVCFGAHGAGTKKIKKALDK